MVEPTDPFVEPTAAVATVADSVRAFDVDVFDQDGPSGATYGKTPEIIVRADDATLYVLAHDYDPAEFGGRNPGDPLGATLLRLERTEASFVVTQVIPLRYPVFLERLLGFDRAPSGQFYVASSVQEDDVVNASYPSNAQYREGIVHISQLASNGELIRLVDLDVARTNVDGNGRIEQVINPMTAATGRLAFGDGYVMVTHGINTVPDPDIDNRRHQKALTTVVDMNQGLVERTSTIWVSHSFDQRLVWDGEAFVEMHLGDAFPRHIAVGRTRVASDARTRSFPVIGIKGGIGANVTRTRLGNVVPLPDAEASHLAVFVAERTVGTQPVGPNPNISGSREVGMTRFVRGFDTSDGAHLDSSLPDRLLTQDVQASLRWLTNHDATDGQRHADRPAVVALADDRYLVLWEEWDLGYTLTEQTFDGVYGMVIDSMGQAIFPASRLADGRLPRGDDPVSLRTPGSPDVTGAWVTADAETGAMTVHTVDAFLQYRAFVVP